MWSIALKGINSSEDQGIKGAKPRSPQLEKRPTFPVAGNEELTRLSLLPDDAPEDMEVQIE
ncbi:MAG: hypothetical protein JO170_17810 [Verrucomicrobia bacterium]|nr:hypothetical protein [Verrucomicrobiota bacterium]